jgi:hypothetical protein
MEESDGEIGKRGPREDVWLPVQIVKKGGSFGLKTLGVKT